MATTESLVMTVPSGAKNGLLILCGSHWNHNEVSFSEPSGSGIITKAKVHDAYNGGTYANSHIVIYTVSLKLGGTITATSNYNDATVGKTMILLY